MPVMYKITVLDGEKVTKTLGSQTIQQVGIGLTLFGTSSPERAEHLGILLRAGRTQFVNTANSGIRVEEEV